VLRRSSASLQLCLPAPLSFLPAPFPCAALAGAPACHDDRLCAAQVYGGSHTSAHTKPPASDEAPCRFSMIGRTGEPHERGNGACIACCAARNHSRAVSLCSGVARSDCVGIASKVRGVVRRAETGLARWCGRYYAPCGAARWIGSAWGRTSHPPGFRFRAFSEAFLLSRAASERLSPDATDQRAAIERRESTGK
jgi:hypothetical protein